MEIKQLVESIVRDVISALSADAPKAAPPRVLYIFGDSASHEAYMDHFIALQNRGIAHDLMFLDGETSAWLGKHRIESGGPGKVIAVDEFAPAPIEVPLEYDGIVIPEIDLDTMARASLGIRGTVLSDVLFSALVTEKFVLIGEDVSGLKRADRRTLKTLALPQPFRNLFDYYRKELAMYGASFGPRAALADMAAARCGQPDRSGAAVQDPGLWQSDDDKNGERYDGKLVSEEWVKRRLKEGALSLLILRPGAIVTPLARDLLRENGISVRWAAKR